MNQRLLAFVAMVFLLLPGCKNDKLVAVKAGEACGPNATCEIGTRCFESYCRPDRGSACEVGSAVRCIPEMICEGGICVGAAGDSCSDSDPCASAFACVAGTCATGPGGACDGSTPCLPDNLCEGGICKSGRRSSCTDAAAVCAKGLQCDSGVCLGRPGSECTDVDDCASGYACSAGVCSGKPGSDCTAGPPSVPCVPGASCEAGSCRGGSGSSCAGGVLCASGLVCENDSCHGGLGTSCDPDNPCTSDLVCHAGSCKSGSGGACASDSQCAAGLVCGQGQCGVGVGGACDAGVNDCIPGFSCTGGFCRTGGGGNCASSNDCDTGLSCYQGTCRAPAGGACAGDAGCADTLSCLGGSCRVPAGGVCALDAECAPAYVCDSGVCLGGGGVSCTASSDCASGYSCDPTTNTCRAPVLANCVTTTECQSQLVCDGGICLASAGGSCAANIECQGGYLCVQGSCTLAPGGPCASSADCGTNQQCIGGSCRAPVGDPCAVTADCQLGLDCIANVCQSIPDPISGVVDTATNPPRLVVHRSGVSGSRQRIRALPSCCTSMGWCNYCGNHCTGWGTSPQAQGGSNWTTGDINGDGYTDLITISGGSASVLFGKPFGKNDAASYTEPAMDMSLGWSGAGGLQSLAVGDMNDDGVDDIIMGGAKPWVAIVFGQVSWSAGLSLGPVDGISPDTGLAVAADVLLTSPASWGSGSYMVGGTSALATGDFNGDGADDLAIGYVSESTSVWVGNRLGCTVASCSQPVQSCTAALSSTTRILLGLSAWAGGGQVMDLSQPSTQLIFSTTTSSTPMGSFMALEDLDADFQADLVVSGWNGGLASETGTHVFKGSTYPPGTSRLYTAADYEIVRPVGGGLPTVDTLEGERLLITPDMVDRGHLYFTPTVAAPVTPLNTASPPAATRTLQGRDFGQEFGYAHAVGDFDGDGLPDLAVGAPNAGSVENAAWANRGVVYVFYGGNAALSASVGLAMDSDAKIVGAAAGERFGEKLRVGDFNADGYDDLFVSREGTVDVFVIFGGPRVRP